MIIRKALLEDSEAITELLMLASGKVMYKFMGEKDYLKAVGFLHYFVQNTGNQYSFQNCYVAVDNGEIVGAMLVYDGAKLQELRKPVLEYIHQHFDRNMHVEKETQAGEYYIDSLAVFPTQQGKGIASKLLQFLIQVKSEHGDATLGLLVDRTNPRAKKLYLKLGFKLVGEKELLGISLEHLQLKLSSSKL
ncbi:GNAT family N-acetyltransferase [Algoriphagus chordae]|uniref:Acetyltransferase (GNAT) family protein n=1 Tax=Algoriphagus chordae TaxID=237019 RepID=A0A2W7R2B5_9BACT|nr:GNAT family N-acetyltransferase [Algoriphagus chordae]PZX54938.1 acetyltransferase (GNAT) family protein [Algoriphagus chordae]